MSLSTSLLTNPFQEGWARLTHQQATPPPQPRGSEGLDLLSLPFLLGLVIGALILAPACYYGFRALRARRQRRTPTLRPSPSTALARTSAGVPRRDPIHRAGVSRRDPIHAAVEEYEHTFNRAWDEFRRRYL